MTRALHIHGHWNHHNREISLSSPFSFNSSSFLVIWFDVLSDPWSVLSVTRLLLWCLFVKYHTKFIIMQCSFNHVNTFTIVVCGLLKVINEASLGSFILILLTLEITWTYSNPVCYIGTIKHIQIGFPKLLWPLQDQLVGFPGTEGFASPIDIQYCSYFETVLAFVGHYDSIW